MFGRRFVIAITACLLIALIQAGSASACSCRQLPLDERLRAADAAVVATLLEVVERDRWTSDYHFRVERVYRLGTGITAGATLTVRAATSGPACGLGNEIGWRHGLFLGHRGGFWRSSLCALFDPAEMAALFRGVRRNANIGAEPAAAVASCAA
jgi:hypothetical protein